MLTNRGEHGDAPARAIEPVLRYDVTRACPVVCSFAAQSVGHKSRKKTATTKGTKGTKSTKMELDECSHRVIGCQAKTDGQLDFNQLPSHLLTAVGRVLNDNRELVILMDRRTTHEPGRPTGPGFWRLPRSLTSSFPLRRFHCERATYLAGAHRPSQ
jgi:hypothetical protein